MGQLAVFPSGERIRPPSSNVVVIYEDFGTRKQARKGLEYVANEFGSDFEIKLWMWPLDTLQDPKRSVRATPSFAESDLLVISLRTKRKINERRIFEVRQMRDLRRILHHHVKAGIRKRDRLASLI